MYYLAFVHTDVPGYGFTVPDIAGFTAHVETDDFDCAVAEARRAIASHLAAIRDTGGVLPEARSLAALRCDPDLAEDWKEAATTVMLPAIVPGGRTLRVNLSIDERTLAMIDSAAADRSLTRSAFLVEAARELVSA